MKKADLDLLLVLLLCHFNYDRYQHIRDNNHIRLPRPNASTQSNQQRDNK